MQDIVRVDLSERSYDIVIGTGLVVGLITVLLRLLMSNASEPDAAPFTGWAVTILQQGFQNIQDAADAVIPKPFAREAELKAKCQRSPAGTWLGRLLRIRACPARRSRAPTSSTCASARCSWPSRSPR